jgi:phosphopantetheinyl transferase (holo-ACP synthase)
MIGNDIVDLDIVLKENKASNLRYLNKICTENEIKTIQGSIDPNITLWRIWTIKEAAYKIINKSNGIRAYIPKKIETVLISEAEAEVNSPWGKISVFTILSNDHYIHSIASISDNPFFAGVEKVYPESNPSESVRICCLQDLVNKMNLKSNVSLQIRTENNIPFVYLNEDKLPVNLSLSHHGKFVAWSFCEY